LAAAVYRRILRVGSLTISYQRLIYTVPKLRILIFIIFYWSICVSVKFYLDDGVFDSNAIYPKVGSAYQKRHIYGLPLNDKHI
jgi:hypothetical protein